MGAECVGEFTVYKKEDGYRSLISSGARMRASLKILRLPLFSPPTANSSLENVQVGGQAIEPPNRGEGAKKKRRINPVHQLSPPEK